MMHIGNGLELDLDETKRLEERWERLRASLPRLRQAARGEEPFSEVAALEDEDA